MKSKSKLVSVDLFCGCGGFSLGFERAGINTLAALDVDPKATAVFQHNLPSVKHVYCEDLTIFTPPLLASRIGTDSVDVIVGGPPCQGFSTIRQRDGSNHGPRLVVDPRRELYLNFLAYVGYFKPSVFVMENVLGIRSAQNGRYFSAIPMAARRMGYRVHSQIVKAWEFGVPQQRKRQLIIGTRMDIPVYFREELFQPVHEKDWVTLGEAIMDLPLIQAGDVDDPRDYDMKLRRKHVKIYGERYLFGVMEVARASVLTAHTARPHSERDLRDFAKLEEGENSRQAMREGVQFEFPYDKTNFKDRYTRQHRDRLCSTIVAHLDKDGLMYIHPTQNRSLTPREAARVQGFPDWFYFPVARTHQYRLIGNAIPPLVSEAVGSAIKRYFSEVARLNVHHRVQRYVPDSPATAAGNLLRLVDGEKSGILGMMNAEEFNAGWCSIAYLFPWLHPESINDHGLTVSSDLNGIQNGGDFADILSPYYTQSGWPVALSRVLREARNRYETEMMSADVFFCSDALRAGIIYNHKVTDNIT